MPQQVSQFEHVFRYRYRTVRLICSIEKHNGGSRMLLHDVLATTQRTVSSVPDWRIEAEASKAACDRGAKYL